MLEIGNKEGTREQLSQMPKINKLWNIPVTTHSVKNQSMSSRTDSICLFYSDIILFCELHVLCPR